MSSSRSPSTATTTELLIELDRGGDDRVQQSGFGSQSFGTSIFGSGAFADRETTRIIRPRDREMFDYKRRVSALSDFRLDLPGDYAGWEGADVMAWVATRIGEIEDLDIDPDLLDGLDFGDNGYGEGGFGDSDGQYDPEDLVEVDGTIFNRETLQFRGRVGEYEYATDANMTTLNGPGIGHELTNEEITLEFEHLPAWEALSIYLREYVDEFDAAVHPPEPQPVFTDELIQDVSNDDELEEFTDLEDTDPVHITDGAVELQQACWTTDAEQADFEEPEAVADEDETGGVDLIEDDAFSRGQGIRLAEPGDFVQLEIEPGYTIPQMRVGVRAQATDSPAIQVTVDGDPVDTIVEEEETLDLQWLDAREIEESAQDISGTTEIRIEAIEVTPGYGGSAPPGHCDIDVIAPYDVRYQFSFPNEVDENGYLSGPELLPHMVLFASERAETSWNVEGATLTTEWDNADTDIDADADALTSNQALGLSNDDIIWQDEEQTDVLRADFADSFGYGARASFALARYGEREDGTPTQGVHSHRLAGWQIEADMNDLIVVEYEEVDGTHLANIESLADTARMDFYLPHEPDDERVVAFHAGQLERDFPDLSLAEFEELKTSSSINDYANIVIVKGRLDPESDLRVRGEAEAQDEEHFERYGEELYTVIDPSITTDTDAQARARKLLADKVTNAEFGGTITGLSLEFLREVDLDPGVAYQINQWDRHVSLDALSVRYDASGGAAVDLDFDGTTGPAAHFLEARAHRSDLDRTV